MGEGGSRLSRRWPWVLSVLLGLLLVAYGGAAWALGDRVPADVKVAGVDVGGLTRANALEVLERDLGPRLSAPFDVTVGDAKETIDPQAAGLTVDLEATVDGLVGFSVDPRSLWRHVRGDGEVDVVLEVAEDKLAAYLDDLADRVDSEPVDGAVSFVEGAAIPSPAMQGRVLDVDEAAETVAEEWPSSGEPIDLPAEITEPAIGQDAVLAAMSSFASPATAGPLVVMVGDIRTELPPQAVTPALSMRAQDGALVPAVDGEVLKAAVLGANPTLQTEPKDASIRIEGGAPVVVQAANGVTIDAAALAQSAVTALTTPERTATLQTAVAEPELTTAEAEALGVKEVVSEFATNLTADAGRTENISIASRTVNGTLLLPGETFSLNETLGRRTAEKGYNEAPVIVNGRLTRDYGGGVSQVATTLFNGMFFAGLEDVEHKPHSFYISRYPEGREATVNYPTVDLKFTNDSQYGVLIEMWVGGGQVHTRFWSTKVWDVTAVKGARTNVKAPDVLIDPSPDCVSQSAQAGFDVKVTRVFSQGGQEKKRETFSTRYIPEDQVTCTGTG